jgi:drug/metabolite transporter (DMT)-like permease
MPCQDTTRPRDGLGPLLAYAAVCIVWGSTFLALRIGVQTIPPWTLIATRCVLAGSLMTGFALWRGARLPGPRALASAAITGMLLFSASQGMVAWGELRVPSGEAAVLCCTVSLLTPAVSWLMGASGRPNPLAVLGLVVGFAGVVVLARLDGRPADQMACLAILAAQFAWAIGAAIARKIPPADSPLLGSGLQLLAGAPAAAAFAGLRGEWTGFSLDHVSTHSALALFYLVVMGSIVAFGCFGWLVQIWKPERLSTYAYINPVVALLLGAAILGETVGLREVLATALILGAVGIVMVSNRLSRPHAGVPACALEPITDCR